MLTFVSYDGPEQTNEGYHKVVSQDVLERRNIQFDDHNDSYRMTAGRGFNSVETTHLKWMS